MPQRPMKADELRGLINVSRETLERLEAYVAALKKWNDAVNLISPATVPDVWRRHILDSAQLAPQISQDAKILVDLGTGAGLPGLILAILLNERPKFRPLLVDSDARKCAFLRVIAGDVAPKAEILTERIESLPRLGADVVTARALAPIASLIGYAEIVAGPKATCLFLKGRGARKELTDAKETWNMQGDLRPSLSDPSGSVVVIRAFRRRHGRGE